MNYFLLNKAILIKLRHMFSRINFVVARLSDWHDQASSEAAACEYSHNAEIEEHGSPRVHVLSRRDACVQSGSSIFVLSFCRFSFHLLFFTLYVCRTWCLGQHQGFAAQLRLHSAGVGNHYLRKVGGAVFDAWLEGVELVP